MGISSATHSLKTIAGAMLAACAIALCAALPGQAWADTMVAEVGGTEYSSLQAAVNDAKNGDTVTVIASHELTWDGSTKIDGSLASMVVVAGKDITIDLNGKALTIDAGKMAGVDLYAAFAADEDGSLTLEDSKSTGSVTATGIGFKGSATAYCLLMAYEDGTKLVVNGGTYSMASAGDNLVYAGGHTSDIAYVNGGNFTLGNVGTGENGKPWIFNVLGAADNHVNVTGGTFNANIQRQHWASEVAVPETHYVLDNGDGTWTVKEGSVLSVKEGIMSAQWYFNDWLIGYPSLEAFINAANNDTTRGNTTDLEDPITLLKDAEVNTALVLGDAATVDCNGHNVVLTDASASLVAPAGLSVITTVANSEVAYEDGTYVVRLAKYDVSFNSNGGSEVASSTATGGEPFSKPADPTREGYTFGGWYTDEACTAAYDFTAPAAGDITLYAKWTEINDGEGEQPTGPTDGNKNDKDNRKAEPEDELAKTGDATGVAAAGAGIALVAAGAIALAARRRVA